MKAKWTGALTTALACAITMTLAAQTPPAGGAQAPGAMQDDKVTVTGCLERAQAATATTGTTGGAASAAADVKFVLKEAMAIPGAGEARPTGTTGGKMASSYNLSGDEAKLTPHVGHKIEITGTMHKAMGTGAARTDPEAPRPTGAMAAPMLKVESVKMISADCDKDK